MLERHMGATEIDKTLAAYRILFEAIYANHPVEALEGSWISFQDEVMDDRIEDWFDKLVNVHLVSEQRDYGTRDTGLIIELDWKAADASVAWSANRALRAQGIEQSFEWRLPDSGISRVLLGLHALNEWLSDHSLALLNLDTGGDWYALAIVRASDVPGVLEAAAEIPVGVSGAAVVSRIPDDWAVDPIPSRSQTADQYMYVLMWAHAPDSGQEPRWCSEFRSNETEFSLPAPKGRIEDLEARFLERYPDRLTMLQRRPQAVVGRGVPDSWFVVYEKPPHPDSYGAHRFEGPFLRSRNGRDRELCKHLDDALGFFDMVHATNAAGFGQQVITVALARELEANPEH